MQAVRPEKSVGRPSTGEEPVSGRYCTDANIFMECWNRIYPLAVLPPLWEKIARHRNDIILIKPTYDQIAPKDMRERKEGPLSAWLGKNRFIKTSGAMNPAKPETGYGSSRLFVLVSAEASRAVGTATTPSPVTATKKVKIFPPVVTG